MYVCSFPSTHHPVYESKQYSFYLQITKYSTCTYKYYKSLYLNLYKGFGFVALILESTNYKLQIRYKKLYEKGHRWADGRADRTDRQTDKRRVDEPDGLDGQDGLTGGQTGRWTDERDRRIRPRKKLRRINGEGLGIVHFQKCFNERVSEWILFPDAPNEGPSLERALILVCIVFIHCILAYSEWKLMDRYLLVEIVMYVFPIISKIFILTT